MTLTEYMNKAASTAVFDARHATTYLGLGLAGETGEAVDCIKKRMRNPDDDMLHADQTKKLRAELGDVAWYWSQICKNEGFVPEEILQENLDKLAARKAANTIVKR